MPIASEQNTEEEKTKRQVTRLIVQGMNSRTTEFLRKSKMDRKDLGTDEPTVYDGCRRVGRIIDSRPGKRGDHVLLLPPEMEKRELFQDNFKLHARLERGILSNYPHACLDEGPFSAHRAGRNVMEALLAFFFALCSRGDGRRGGNF